MPLSAQFVAHSRWCKQNWLYEFLPIYTITLKVILSRTSLSESLSIEISTCPSHYHYTVSSFDVFMEQIKQKNIDLFVYPRTPYTILTVKTDFVKKKYTYMLILTFQNK